MQSSSAHWRAIACERCGAAAQLIHRKPDDARRDGGAEIQTFLCASCGHLMTRKAEVSTAQIKVRSSAA
jgi:ribosomal protein L37E